LEKAIDKIMLAGIPCMAVPLLSSDCRNTSVDEDWVEQMVRVPHQSAAQTTRSYLHLLRKSAQLFKRDSLEKLAPPLRGGSVDVSRLDELDPIAATAAIAYDFLAAGGKYSRPIETFHKASLVHDDIEDADQYRYGAETLHKKWGVPTAINVGDYLIGMGYRLVSKDRKLLGGDMAADILDYLASSHQRLAEGQGAELIWRDARDRMLKPIDALKIYALKTSPAFEAALYTGVRLAGDAEELIPTVKTFARNMGVAFQILNDLKDWERDDENKRVVGADLLGGRPTVLWALALEGLKPELREELLGLSAEDCGMPPERRIMRARQLFFEAGVFETAYRLVDKHQQKAEEIADEVEELGDVLYAMDEVYASN
jgi:geranylgeranyl pyrophosphate synthase